MGADLEGNHPDRDQIVPLGPISNMAKLIRHYGWILLYSDMSANNRFVQNEILARWSRPLRKLRLTLHPKSYDRLYLAGFDTPANGNGLRIFGGL